jgi:hypothetical protein
VTCAGRSGRPGRDPRATAGTRGRGSESVRKIVRGVIEE